MIYKIVIRKKVKKFIEKRVSKDKEIIKSKLKLLQENPYPNPNLDIKKLANSEFFRLRVKDYRFIYEIIDDELILLMLDGNNRGDIY